MNKYEIERDNRRGMINAEDRERLREQGMDFDPPNAITFGGWLAIAGFAIVGVALLPFLLLARGIKHLGRRS